METPRISASSYSNTAPLIWSFLYGSQHGRVEIILDNAPARSAELLSQNRVDAALVPVIAFQQLDDVLLIPDVCVGARKRARSVCLITRGQDLSTVRSVSLDASSKTSTILTKIIFREFLGFEPEWRSAEPNVDEMLDVSDCALLIGDPALKIGDCGWRISDFEQESVSPQTKFSQDSGAKKGADAGESAIRNPQSAMSESAIRNPQSAIPESENSNPQSAIRVFDLAELWHQHTGLGFVFAMWMTRNRDLALDFAAARDEGVSHLAEIVTNYETEIGLGRDEMLDYLSENISYSVDESMQTGMELYFKLAEKGGLIERPMRPIRYLE